MQVILKGSLRHFPPAALLRFLSGCGQGGTLDLVSAEGEKVRLFVRDGSVICAQGAGGAGDLVGCVAAAVGFEDGAFALVDEVVLPEGASAEAAVAVDAVIAAAEQRIAEAKSFPDAARFHVVENVDGQPQISMTADEFKLILRIGGAGNSFGELVEGRSREELTATLRSMEERGLIAREEEKTERLTPAAAPPPEPPPPPPEAPTQIFDVPPATAETAAPPVRRAATLTGDGDESYVLLDDIYTVGRDLTSDIPVSDSSISTHHARFVRDGESYSLEDLGSRNGTFVNGEQVTASRSLADNDVVRFGRVIFTFNLANEIRPGETTERRMARRTRQ